MNTFQLSCFLAVVETLNFARAAEQLNVTQPAITHQIHSLETELNVKLFKRTTRSVKMTDAAFAFLDDAQHILAISQRAIKRFENPYGQEMQILSIGCHSIVHLFLLPEVLGKTAEQFADLHPRLQVVPFQHLNRLLEEDDVDAIIGFQEPDPKKAPGHYRELAKIPVVCLCSPQNSLAKRRTVKISDLEKEKLVLSDIVRAPARIAKLQGQLMGGRTPSSFYFCGSAEATIVLVQSGFGISVLPDLCIPSNPSLVRIPIEGIEPISFGIYYKSLQGNAPLKSFMKIMQKYFDDEASRLSSFSSFPQSNPSKSL